VKSSNQTAIIGGASAGVVILVLGGFGIVFFIKRKRTPKVTTNFAQKTGTVQDV
jgi:hypothetical protein